MNSLMHAKAYDTSIHSLQLEQDDATRTGVIFSEAILIGDMDESSTLTK